MRLNVIAITIIMIIIIVIIDLQPDASPRRIRI